MTDRGTETDRTVSGLCEHTLWCVYIHWVRSGKTRGIWVSSCSHTPPNVITCFPQTNQDKVRTYSSVITRYVTAELRQLAPLRVH